MDLPELVPFTGNWDEYVEELYAIYEREIVRGGLAFDGWSIRCQFRPPYKGKGFGFWHLISEGSEEDERTPDLRRCERIRWIAWMIQRAGGDERISWWENRRGRDTRVVLWMEDHDFAVIMAKRNGYWLLKTAYCLKPHRREAFRKEREAFWRARKG